MYWTKEIPTNSGYYWIRDKYGNVYISLIDIYDGGHIEFSFFGTEVPDLNNIEQLMAEGNEYYGPLTEPPINSEHNSSYS